MRALRARLVCGAAPLHWTGLDRHGRSGRLRTAGTMSVPVRSRDEAAAAVLLASVVHPGVLLAEPVAVGLG